MRLLLVNYGLPWPLNEGTKMRDYHLLRELSKTAEIVLLSLCKDDPSDTHPAEVKQFCLATETFVPPPKSLASLPSHLLAGLPAATYPFYFPQFAARIAALAATYQAEVVQIEHSFLAPYVSAVPAHCRSILSLQNIGQRQYETMARLSGAGLGMRLKAFAMRGWEAHWAQRFDHCIAVSEDEAQWVRQRAPSLPVTVVDNGVDCGRLRMLPPPAGKQVLFVGALGYPPNANAVVQFATTTLPLLHRFDPEVQLIVVGHHAPAAVRALAAKGVLELHENVPDVVPYYNRAAACVVPLQAGGGTRLKILEAMALGRPIVSTPIGCEGLQVEHGEQLLIADKPQEMAVNLADLLGNRQMSDELCHRARAWVEQRHDWRGLGVRLAAVHRQLATSAKKEEA